MVTAVWIILGLGIAVLVYRTYSQLRRLQHSLVSAGDRLSAIASRTEGRLEEMGRELGSLREMVSQKAVPVENPYREIPMSSPLETSPRVSSLRLEEPSEDNPVTARLQRLLDEEINPAVAMHGGHVQLIDVRDNVAYVQLGGGCQGCGMVDVTLRQGIEARMKEVVPELQELVDVTDHRGGTNPYYSPGKG